MHSRVWVIALVSCAAAAAGLLVTTGLSAGGPPQSPAAYPICTVDGGGGADYTTIAAALADSNCETINVAAGVYTENLTVDRDVTLNGAGAISTVIDGNGQVTHQRVISITTPHHVSIADVTIQHGYAITPAHGGGGIKNRGFLTLTSVILTQNVVSGTESSDIGGAISPGGFGSGGLVMEDCVVSHNTADRGGGIFFNSTLWITNTLIHSNTARAGAGINNWGAMTLTNVTFSDNYGGNNGGALTNHGTAALINCTVAENSRASAVSAYGTTTLVNTLLADNSHNCSGPVTSGGHNLEDADSCGLDASGDITDTAPLLGPLQDNGGPSWTHALHPSSPAIDKGDNSECPLTDQRGVSRPVDGDGDSIATCDIGAYEYQPIIYLPLVLRSYP